MRPSATSRPRIQRRWPIAVLASCAAIVAAACVFDLRINVTDSAPRGLYRATRPPRIERDALVIACLPEPIARLGRARGYLRAGDCPADSQAILKRIVAVPGDSVRVSASGVVVNGRTISGTELRAVDRAGQPLTPAFLDDRQLGADDLWLLGLDPTVSWDSRYFGALPIESVRASAVPIWTVAGRNGARETSAAALRERDVQ